MDSINFKILNSTLDTRLDTKMVLNFSSLHCSLMRFMSSKIDDTQLKTEMHGLHKIFKSDGVKCNDLSFDHANWTSCCHQAWASLESTVYRYFNIQQ